MSNRVLTGLECLVRDQWATLRGLRVGLVTHPAAIDAAFRSTVDLFREVPGVQLAALFGPEHGFFGQEQDLVPANFSPRSWGKGTGLPHYSLYGETVESLRPNDEQLRGLDALVIDLQDIGSRYYTFQATMLYCMEAAARRKLLTVILDRPNPLGGEVVEGPMLQPGYDSFVGPHPIPTRHGLTMGELAHLYRSERGMSGDLRVIPCEGWRRSMSFDQTGLPWVLPSPNMPALETAFVYPGQCLLEGTNLSEGRGTTRPFEFCGAPWIDPHMLTARLREENLPGVALRPLWFRPTFQKFAGQSCGGVQLHVTDRDAFRPVRTGLCILAALRELCAPHFDWRREPYEFVSDRLAIDLLFGSPRERLALEAGESPQAIALQWEPDEGTFLKRRQCWLLYS
ncbi:MAG: DUF1343 domain-containing protein [Gemmataceae bacterium]|nr:DUF1343 domain-containing protein [Gemmataceae bacterium]